EGDTALRTSSAGVFAVGNLLHPVDTADIAALDGKHVARAVRAYLDGAERPGSGIRLVADAPLRWVAPQIVRAADAAPARKRLLLWADAFKNIPTVTATQGDRTVKAMRLPWPMVPGRVFRVPYSLLDGVDPLGGEVRIGVR
ncbi:MAG: pyridine nucleotide-disulfide oxidoreductase, partial [Actinomycetia bacterium]|nr:pyridine nucleotide-disulfide oxidoreductase [Actinomycetes bacterium]